MRLLLVLFAFLVMAPAALGASSYGSPPELAGLDYPEPRAYVETQDWWGEKMVITSTSLFDFATLSSHVHMGINFPFHEVMQLPPAGSGLNWDYLAQYHESIGASVRQVRGGMTGAATACPDDGIPFDPAFKGVKITEQDQRHAGFIPYPNSKVNCWRDEVGSREFRFTADTTSVQGKRQYQSFGIHACFNTATCAAGGVTARGWYEGPGYTNVNLKGQLKASTLADGTAIRPGQNLGYSLAQGATWGFALLDANIHAHNLGTVLKPLTKASSGSFTIPADIAPGDHVLLLGGLEQTAGGINAGVLRLPFHVN